MMHGTGVPIEAGAYAADLALLVAAIVSLTICLTVVILVLAVDRNDRVTAIKALAPVLLSLCRATRRWRDEHGARPRDRIRRKNLPRIGDNCAASEARDGAATGVRTKARLWGLR